MLTRSPLSRLASVLVSAVTLLLAACSSGERVADAASMAEAKKVPPPVMQGETTFFENQLLVEVNLGRGFRPRIVRSSAMFDREPADGRSVFDAAFIAEEPEPETNIWQRKNSPLPPVALRVRVHNTTAAPVEIEFLECKSYLGNFAVRPEKITIPAGESGQPDAMVSLLGVSGQEIPVTLSLRWNGKSETRTVVIVPVKPVAAPARANGK